MSVRRRFVPPFEIWLLRLFLIRVLRGLSGPLPRLFCPFGRRRVVGLVQHVRVALWIRSFGHRPLRLRGVQSERTSNRSVPREGRRYLAGDEPSAVRASQTEIIGRFNRSTVLYQLTAYSASPLSVTTPMIDMVPPQSPIIPATDATTVCSPVAKVSLVF